MDRNCKNCGHNLYVGQNYCSICGAKWIEKRITMRNVFHDFSDMYLGIDTKFFRTFIDLFRRPEAVINGYITGRRNHHVDALRYLLVAVFLGGIYALVLNKTGAFDQMLESSAMGMGVYEDIPQEQLAAQKEFQEKFAKAYKDWFFDFQSLIYFLSIPYLAFVARLTFWGKRFYNYTEQMVFYMYTYSQFSILTAPINIAIALFATELISVGSFIWILPMLIYIAYVYKRVFQLSLGEVIIRSLKAIIIFALVNVVLGILLVLIGALITIAYMKLFKGA